MLIFCPASAVL